MKSLSNSVGIARAALILALAAVAPMLVTTTDVSAQEITGQVDGTILQPNGQPAVGTAATITDTRDGRRQTSTANSRGIISFRGMGAGGPYTVRIDGGSYGDVTVTDIYADIGGTSTFTVTLTETDPTMDEITVTASQIAMVTVASGPSSTFTLEDITNMPSTTRQIRDIIRIDPRVSIGRTGDGGDQSGSISCLGGSSRTNSFTIDGVRATDAFGLNLSGNLSRFTFPIPFDTVDAAAVEFAPVSVEYGQFSGCNINVVTKSGENDFHGSAFYLFNSDSLTGDKIGGNLSNSGFANTGDFERKNFGFDFSGPIIQDKLFFYVAYEETDTASINAFGTADSNFQRKGTLTTAEVNRIRDILIAQYGRDPGEIVTNLPIVSERIFARLDWNINDDHRVEFNYSDLQESTIIGDDIGGGRGQFTFSDNFHSRGSDSQTYALRLYSDWTDRLSTEVRYSNQEVLDLQNPVGGGEAQDTNLPRIAIGSFGEFGGEFFGQDFVSGPGTFRSANKLSTSKDQLKLTADYLLGDHKITAGYEYESLDIFNLFIINATGTIFFADIDELEAGTAYEIRKGGSFTQDPNDAAAVFSRDINSVFLQDTWDVSDDLQVIYGLRYDWYTSDDSPMLNPNYVARYGFSNQVAFDGLDAVQPRLGFNYTMPERFGDTRINAGFGVFSGNDPTVWFSNAFQNFGGALGVGSVTGVAGPTTCTGDELNVLVGGFTGVPSCVVEAAQNQALNNAGAVNATDPNFKLPTINRYSFGVEHHTDFESDFFSNWLVKADVIYSDLQDSVEFLDLGLTQINTAPDGRPIYATVDPLIAGCSATFNGIGQGYSGLGDPQTDPCFGGLQHVIMTNRGGDDGYTFTAAFQASKLFEWGDGWTLNVGGGYAYNESEVGNPGNSFTASGNFRSVVTDDLASSPVGNSYRNTPHNFTFQGTLTKDFIPDHTTSITAFLQVRDGNPLSLTYNRGFASGFGDSSGRARNLLYVPTSETDPLVNFNMSNADVAAFFAFTDSLGLARGAIAPKGVLDEDWSTDMDIRIQQEIPFFKDSKIKLFIDIENFLNLLNEDNGTKKFVNTTDILSAVAVINGSVGPVDPMNPNGAQIYNYDSFSPIVESADTLDSLWKVQFGIRGEF